MTDPDGTDTPGRRALAIIGGGPNSTYAIERLSVLLGERPGPVALDVYVFEKTGLFGAGNVHRPDQPRSSLLNRIAGQVAFAPDESYREAERLLPKPLRPTLYEWARQRFRETKDEQYDIQIEDWPPRRLLGEALTEHFDKYVARLRQIESVRVCLCEEHVSRVDPEGSRYVLRTSNSDRENLVVDLILFATGNSANRPWPGSPEERLERCASRSAFRYVSYPYPLTNIDTAVAKTTDVVGCIGLGQTANDVILYLTEERGGRFVRAEGGDRLRYVPSGREPARIVAFSQSGVFTAARPFNEKMADLNRLEHTGVFFTTEALDSLREHRGRQATIDGYGAQRQLDFSRDVFPIMHLEMECLYYRTLFGPRFGDRVETMSRSVFERFVTSGVETAAPRDAAIDMLSAPLRALVERAVGVVESFLQDTRLEVFSVDDRAIVGRFLATVFGSHLDSEVEAYFTQGGLWSRSALADGASPFGHPADPRRHLFSWELLTAPIPLESYDGPAEYGDAVVAYMDHDIQQAKQGSIANPTKAATDGVWRDLRETIAYAIDFGGLTASSHREFHRTYMRYHNRLADGASLELMEKMVALVRAGVLDVSTGPGADIEIDQDRGVVEIHGSRTGSRHRVDAVIDAKLSNIDLDRDRSPLYSSLRENGLIQPWRNPGHDGEPDYIPGGPLLTRDCHPIGHTGRPVESLSFLGPPTEGIMFFQGTLARPDCNHQVLNEVIAWAKRIDTQLD